VAGSQTYGGAVRIPGREGWSHHQLGGCFWATTDLCLQQNGKWKR